MTTPDLKLIQWMKNANGTRNYGIRGFDGADVLVSGENSAAIAETIVLATTKLAEAEARADRLELELREARAAVPPKLPATIMGEACVRLDPAHPEKLWILNRAADGWASFGFRVDGWDDLFRRFAVVIGAPRADERGQYWPVTPTRERSTP